MEICDVTRRSLRRAVARIVMVTMMTMVTPGLASAAEAAAERVFAAGSLRDAFVLIIAAYLSSWNLQFGARSPGRLAGPGESAAPAA